MMKTITTLTSLCTANVKNRVFRREFQRPIEDRPWRTGASQCKPSGNSNSAVALSLCVLCAVVVQARASDTFIVKDGQPRAEIVIAEESPRTTRLAAAELQTYVEKISGAKLSIITEPSGEVPVCVYVGRSSHTDKVDNIRGYWRGSMLCALGETLVAAGRKDEALAAYRSVLADDSVEQVHRKNAETAVQSLEGK